MKKSKTSNWQPIQVEVQDSTLVNLTREFEDLTKRIADLDEHSAREEKLREDGRDVYLALAKRVSEVHQMNARTRRERVVRLDNVRELIQQMTGSNMRLENCCNQGSPTDRF